MGEARVLSVSDRDFFRRIGQIVFSNPFSDDRAQRVRELAGDAMRPGMADSEALNAVIGRRLQVLDAEGRIELRRPAGRRRRELSEARAPIRRLPPASAEHGRADRTSGQPT